MPMAGTATTPMKATPMSTVRTSAASMVALPRCSSSCSSGHRTTAHRGHQHGADVDAMGGRAPALGGAEELGGERQEDDAEQPDEHPPDHHRVVRPHPLEQLVLAPPEAADDHEAQGEGEEPGLVLVEEGADRTGGIHEGQDEQGDGNGHHRVAEGDQPMEPAFAVHGSPSMATPGHPAPAPPIRPAGLPCGRQAGGGSSEVRIVHPAPDTLRGS